MKTITVITGLDYDALAPINNAKIQKQIYQHGTHDHQARMIWW